MEKKWDIIDQIIDYELEMFLSVQAKEEPECRQYPDQFKLNRKAQFSIWSEETLNSYKQDLSAARKKNANLMTLKYARMEGLISLLNDSPFVDKIANIMCRWQKELFNKYPLLKRGARPLSSSEDSVQIRSFETYLRSELETYSEKTLRLIYEDMQEYVQNGINGSELIYLYLSKGER